MTQTLSTTGKFSTYLAVTSFAIGTLLLILYLLFPEIELLIYVGYLYMQLALLINGITFLYLFFLFLIHQLEREIIAIRMLLLLANIPIALLYLNIALHTTN